MTAAVLNGWNVVVVCVILAAGCAFIAGWLFVQVRTHGFDDEWSRLDAKSPSPKGGTRGK